MLEQNEINNYKTKLAELDRQSKEIEKQLILLEEQKKQLEEKIGSAFNTLDIGELNKIASTYQKDIEVLEEQLNAMG